MPKKQKIWLSVSLAMFLIPEILWPEITATIFYWLRELFFGISLNLGEFIFSNYLGISYASPISSVLLIFKFLGLLSSTVFFMFFYHSRNNLIKIIFTTILSLYLATLVVSLFLLAGFSNI